MDFDRKKIMEHLWTARWYLTQKPDQIGSIKDEVSKALILLGDKWEEANHGRPKVEEERDRPNDPMPEDFMKGIEEPEFVVVKGARFSSNQYQTPSKMFTGLVVHYTVSGRTAKNATGVVNYLESKGYGCMVMDEDGKIYIPEGFDVLRHWDDHAGVSKWGALSSLSKFFAGMEICCWGKDSKVGPFRESKGEANIVAGTYQQYSPAQEKALINFIMWARAKNPLFKLENVVGHDEVRAAAGKPGDKQDPGASLSMTMPELRKLLADIEKNIKEV